MVTPGHRSDIQGLRAILMMQVLLFHAWTVGSPIGVDSFIMISAYLMTSSFVRRSEAGKMPFFAERWANTFKRLLPPLVITVLVTLGASLLILPVDRWKETTIQSFASITYWENWRLVEVAADYYANDSALSSPLQHLWSMSMQGQVFLLWPVLIALCVVLARKIGANLRVAVAVAFGVLAVLSLGWLLFLAPADGSVYFDTRARIWEFAFGSMIAAAAPWLRLPKKVIPTAVATAFIVLIVYSLVSIGTYPGPMAIVPMACVSVLLLYLPQVGWHPVATILSAKPLVALGNISYAVYLVHWPLFVLYLVHRGRPQLGFVEGVALIAISIVVAFLLTKLVDDPLRHMPWANASTLNKVVVVFISLVVGLVPVALVYLWIEGQERLALADLEVADQAMEVPLTSVPLTGPGSDSFPGARVLLSEAPESYSKPPIPSPFTQKEWATFPEQCSAWVRQNFEFDRNSKCSGYGDPLTADAKVLIVGNSHAQQLLVPQVEPLLSTMNWSAEAILKGACPFGDPSAFGDLCVEHNQMVLDYIDHDPPDYVFLIATRTVKDSTEEQLVPGVVELAQTLTEKGIQVIGLTDNLRSAQDLYECSQEAAASNGRWGGCLLPEEEYFAQEEIIAPLEAIPGVYVVDMRDAYCVGGVCPTTIGNIFVYIDKNHVSVPYSRTVAPFFSERVLALLSLGELALVD